jgi:hypothetical protein
MLQINLNVVLRANYHSFDVPRRIEFAATEAKPAGKTLILC